MSKEKDPHKEEHKAQHKVYKAGDRYVCGECGAEVTYEVPDCPTCSVGLNWGEITKNVRYG